MTDEKMMDFLTDLNWEWDVLVTAAVNLVSDGNKAPTLREVVIEAARLRRWKEKK